MLREVARDAYRRHVRGSAFVRRWVRDPWLRLTVPVPRPRCWAFVCACSNSGTTLLVDVLAAHPDVGSIRPEGQFWTERLPKAIGRADERLWALDLDRYALDEAARIDADMVKRDWARGFDDPRRPVLLEKSPPNAIRMRWLAANFQPAAFVCLIRDGRAVAEGIARKAGHPIDRAARQWARANQRMREDFERLAARKLWLRYEDLAARPIETIERVAELLEISPEPLRRAASAEHRVFGVTSRIGDMNAESVARLSPDERAVIEREAGATMRALGYPIEGR